MVISDNNVYAFVYVYVYVRMNNLNDANKHLIDCEKQLIGGISEV